MKTSRKKLAQSRAYYAAHKTQLSAYSRQYHKENYDKIEPVKRAYRLRKLYGITVEQYNTMLKAQGGRCAVCLRVAPLKKDGSPKWGHKRLAVDHCHFTQVVRGLLCNICNREIIGKIEAYRIDPQRIVDYLKGRSWPDALKEPK